MNTDKANFLQWERGQNYLNWCGRKFETKQPLLSVCLLPDDKGIAFVILFDENTPSEETNAFIIQQESKSKPVFVHDNDGRLVRMLGCYFSKGILILKELIISNIYSMKSFLRFLKSDTTDDLASQISLVKKLALLIFNGVGTRTVSHQADA